MNRAAPRAPCARSPRSLPIERGPLDLKPPPCYDPAAGEHRRRPASSSGRPAPPSSPRAAARPRRPAPPHAPARRPAPQIRPAPTPSDLLLVFPGEHASAAVAALAARPRAHVPSTTCPLWPRPACRAAPLAACAALVAVPCPAPLRLPLPRLHRCLPPPPCRRSSPVWPRSQRPTLLPPSPATEASGALTLASRGLGCEHPPPYAR
nr:vegetative cell wall protein gp1-like [Aegilops tauschii subsp. strangulata]